MKIGDFKQDAKIIVDLCFNTKLFRKDITRDDINAFEEFIEDVMKMRFDSHLRTQELMDSLDKPNKSKKQQING